MTYNELEGILSIAVREASGKDDPRLWRVLSMKLLKELQEQLGITGSCRFLTQPRASGDAILSCPNLFVLANANGAEGITYHNGKGQNAGTYTYGLLWVRGVEGLVQELRTKVLK